MANPSPGSPEWVDLHNSADQAFDLAGWKIDDRKDGAPYTLPQNNIISAGESKRIALPSAMLNNDGDTIRIIAPDGEEITSAVFGTSERGVAQCVAPQGAAPCSITTPTATQSSTPTAIALQGLLDSPSREGGTPIEQPIEEHALTRKNSLPQAYRSAGLSSRYAGVVRTPEPSHTPAAQATPIQAQPSAAAIPRPSDQPHAYDPILALLFGIVAACATFLFYSSQQKLPSRTVATQDEQER